MDTVIGWVLGLSMTAYFSIAAVAFVLGALVGASAITSDDVYFDEAAKVTVGAIFCGLMWPAVVGAVALTLVVWAVVWAAFLLAGSIGMLAIRAVRAFGKRRAAPMSEVGDD